MKLSVPIILLLGLKSNQAIKLAHSGDDTDLIADYI